MRAHIATLSDRYRDLACRFYNKPMVSKIEWICNNDPEIGAIVNHVKVGVVYIVPLLRVHAPRVYACINIGDDEVVGVYRVVATRQTPGEPPYTGE